MKNLNIPYLSQLDNRYVPFGTCNLTSMAMCIKYLGFIGDGSEAQLEDQLFKKCQELGLSRHNPHDLKKLIETIYPGTPLSQKLPIKLKNKIIDNFTENGSFQNIKDAIDKDIPCIVHGYFTRSGHIIVIRGYDDTGFFVNDPYGEYYTSGYDTSVSGENLHYSYDLISRLCSPESVSKPNNIWLHRIQRIS